MTEEEWKDVYKRYERIENEWIDWQNKVNKEIEKTHYRVVYLPEKELMPFESLEIVTKLSDSVEGLLAQWEGEAAPIGNLLLKKDWAEVLSTALMVYRTVLLTVHKDKIKEAILKQNEAWEAEKNDEQRKDD